jgi:hypothetical protein
MNAVDTNSRQEDNVSWSPSRFPTGLGCGGLDIIVVMSKWGENWQHFDLSLNNIEQNENIAQIREQRLNLSRS